MIGTYAYESGSTWRLQRTTDEYSFREVWGPALVRKLEVFEKVKVSGTLFVMSFSAKMPETVEYREDESIVSVL